MTQVSTLSLFAFDLHRSFKCEVSRFLYYVHFVKYMFNKCEAIALLRISNVKLGHFCPPRKNAVLDGRDFLSLELFWKQLLVTPQGSVWDIEFSYLPLSQNKIGVAKELDPQVVGCLVSMFRFIPEESLTL